MTSIKVSKDSYISIWVDSENLIYVGLKTSNTIQKDQDGVWYRKKK